MCHYHSRLPSRKCHSGARGYLSSCDGVAVATRQNRGRDEMGVADVTSNVAWRRQTNPYGRVEDGFSSEREPP